MPAWCLYTRVCVYVWALGFSLADVSNQSLSRGSLSLYPLSVEPWVDRAGPVHPPGGVVLGGGADDGDGEALGGCPTVKGLRAEAVLLEPR